MPRPPLSEERQKLLGVKSRAKKQQSAAFAGRPRMPGYLTGAAREKWRSLVRYLGQRGVLTPGDGEMIEQYCQIYARWRTIISEIQKDGSPIVECTVTDSSGAGITVRRESPASKLANRLETQLRQFLKDLTLTVASRERAKPAKKNPEEEPPKPGTAGWLLAEFEEKKKQEGKNEGTEIAPAVQAGPDITSI